MGCSTAYFLAKKNVKCTVVERSGIACAASGKAGGFLAKDWCDGTPVGPLARESFKIHMELSKEFPNCDYRCLDTLSVQANQGTQPKSKVNKPEWLDGPIMQTSTLATTETSAQVHPKKLTETFIEKAQELAGSEVVIGHVKGIQFSEEQKVTGVVVGDNVIPADIVVIAMGPWSGQARKWLNIPDVRGSRAHSIVLKPKKTVTPHALFVEYKPTLGRSRSPEIYPRPDGTVYVCGMGDGEHLPDDPGQVTPNLDSCKLMHEIVGELSSDLSESEAEIQTSQACFMPSSSSGLPVIGKVPNVEGVYIATGHTCWGILNGPATGAALAELIVDGKSKIVDLSAFDPANH